MAMVEVKRDFKVLGEVISPENVQVMAELLALKETKHLIGYMGNLAVQIHNRLCCDVFHKEEADYILTDSYDLVQIVAVFLCEHIGEHLDDFLYASKNGKSVTIKMQCYRLIERQICTKARRRKTDTSLETLTRATEPRTETNFEQTDYTKVDGILSQLNLNEYYLTILNCRMFGMSFPEIGSIVNRQISTVWVALNKIKKQYISIMQ